MFDLANLHFNYAVKVEVSYISFNPFSRILLSRQTVVVGSLLKTAKQCTELVRRRTCVF